MNGLAPASTFCATMSGAPTRAPIGPLSSARKVGAVFEMFAHMFAQILAHESQCSKPCHSHTYQNTQPQGLPMKPRKARKPITMMQRLKVQQHNVNMARIEIGNMHAELAHVRRALGALTMKLGELGWANARAGQCGFTAEFDAYGGRMAQPFVCELLAGHKGVHQSGDGLWANTNTPADGPAN